MSAALRAWRPGPGAWDRPAAVHLLRRAGFGATAEELERALGEGLDATLERLFEDRTPPELDGSIQPLLAAESLELLQAWWMARIVAGGAPLRERMTLVWHDLFATSNEKVQDVRLMHRQNELLRREGLGDFRRLLHGIARDPAMLVWLDGRSNRRGHPNENFAREVLELFALGPGHYDERDVQEAARAFSGWDTEGRSFVHVPEHHDDGLKTLLGRTGRFDGADALDLILAHPACARHVARVLLEAFVAPTPSEEEIEGLAATLVASEWDVGRTLRALLRSELFFARRARRARIAAPVECLAVASRALDARVPPRTLARRASAMGQALFRPPSVKGWEGGRAWIHAGHWIARHNALVELAGQAAPERTGAEVLRAVLPEDPPALRTAVERLAQEPSREPTAIALVLTAPEFHLF